MSKRDLRVHGVIGPRFLPAVIVALEPEFSEVFPATVAYHMGAFGLKEMIADDLQEVTLNASRSNTEITLTPDEAKFVFTEAARAARFVMAVSSIAITLLAYMDNPDGAIEMARSVVGGSDYKLKR